jgi:hypothetical protein
MVFSSIYSSRLHFGHNGLCVLGVLMGSQDFVTHFLDKVLFQDVVHIDDFLLLGNA